MTPPIEEHWPVVEFRPEEWTGLEMHQYREVYRYDHENDELIEDDGEPGRAFIIYQGPWFNVGVRIPNRVNLIGRIHVDDINPRYMPETSFDSGRIVYIKRDPDKGATQWYTDERDHPNHIAKERASKLARDKLKPGAMNGRNLEHPDWITSLDNVPEQFIDQVESKLEGGIANIDEAIANLEEEREKYRDKLEKIQEGNP